MQISANISLWVAPSFQIMTSNRQPYWTWNARALITRPWKSFHAKHFATVRKRDYYHAMRRKKGKKIESIRKISNFSKRKTFFFLAHCNRKSSGIKFEKEKPNSLSFYIENIRNWKISLHQHSCSSWLGLSIVYYSFISINCNQSFSIFFFIRIIFFDFGTNL